jgi:hypothetical protein
LNNCGISVILNKSSGADTVNRSRAVYLTFILTLLTPGRSDAQEQLLPVSVGGRAGFINESGRIVIPPAYVEWHQFSDGRALVRKADDRHPGDSRMGYIDREGGFHAVPGADMLEDYHEGLASARFPGAKIFSAVHWCYIDSGGAVVIRTNYETVGDFSEGLAWVEEKIHFLFFVKSDTYGYIDRSGSLAIPTRFEKAGNFSEGLANVTLGGKRGYINRRGEIVIAPRFDAAGSFSGGLAAVRVGDKWGFIDTLGSLVIPPAYEDARVFAEGFAAVKSSGVWGFVRRSGEIAILPRYSDVSGFQEGLSAAQTIGKWGYIDTTGAYRIQPQFDYALPFDRGVAAVEIDRARGYIDVNGKYIWEPAK